MRFTTLLLAATLGVAATLGTAAASCTDGLHNDDELGIDCGGPACDACTCGTDLEREPEPVTLINSNLDLLGDEVETGLAGNSLRVAFELDRKVFLAAANVTEGGSTLEYAAPEVEFVDLAGGSNAALCAFGAGDYTVDLPGGADDPYPACGGAARLWLDSDFASTLRNCGFRLRDDAATDAAGRTFSQFEGQVRVRTEERGALLRGVMTKRVVEVGFTLVVQLPNEVNVSSGVTGVIGTVVELATVSHQVWNLDQRELDLNLFTSVQYPYELVVEGFDLVFDGDGSNPPVSLEGYPVGLPDSDGSGGASLRDYFGAPEASTPADGETDFGTPQELPPTQCVTSSSGSVAADACNQNVHLRLRPSVSWCDVDFDLQLRLAVRCREGVTDAACDTASLPEAGRTATVRFSIDSDNYCPRVVEVAELDGEMALYEDNTWGAHLLEGGPTGETGLAAERQYPGWYPDAARAPGGDNLDERWTQGAFVFGTTLHVETRVAAEAGTNLASSTVSRVFVASADTTDPEAADGSWQRLVYEHVPGAAETAGRRASAVVCDDFAGAADPVLCPVAVSNNVVAQPLSDAVALPASNPGALSPGGPGSFAARLGAAWEGVSRMTIGVGSHTVRVPDGQDAPEGVKVFVELVVTYRAAEEQETLAAGGERRRASVTRTVLRSVTTSAAAAPSSDHPATPPALARRAQQVEAAVSLAPPPAEAGADGDDGDSGVLAQMTGTTAAVAGGAALVVVAAVGAALAVRRRRRRSVAKQASPVRTESVVDVTV